MRRANPIELETLIADLVRRSPLGTHFQAVNLEADNGDEEDFFRVILEFDTLNGVRTEDLLSLISSIEDSVQDVDERLPSVRFAEAA